MSVDPKILVALDYDSGESALSLVEKLTPVHCRLKIGKELFTSEGPDFVRRCQDLGFEIFLDLKFHDIPNTVLKACKAASSLGVWMVNVHASGGAEMIAAAREGVENSSAGKRSLLTAVTVLTSMSQEEFSKTGFAGDIEERVVFLSQLAADAGADGVVCSPREPGLVKNACGPGFLCVTPGVRPVGSSKDDQKRITTPPEALAGGSDYLVIGRPISQAADPGLALKEIVKSIA